MARFAAALVVVAFGVAGAAAPCSGGVCAEVQGEMASPVAVELLQRGSQRKNEDRQIPGLSGILDAASSALDNVTGAISQEVNDVVGNVTKSISDQVSAATSSVTSTAAATVASALNRTVLVLGAEADELYDSCSGARDSVLARMQEAKADAYARLDVLEDQVNGAIAQVLPVWNNISDSVVAASGVATAVLVSVGQEGLAEQFNASLSLVLDQAGAVADSLQNVTELMDGLQNATEEQLSLGLDSVQKTLQSGLQKANAFALHLSDAFGNLTDEAAVKIAAAIPGVNATPIDEAFDSVDATVKRVATELVDGPRELVGGLSEAVGMVEKELPGHKNSAHQAVSGLGLTLFGALLAAIA